MKRSTSLAQSVFTLFTLLTITFTANAHIANNGKPYGGPRGLIQERTSVELTQPTPNHLEITVVDEDGKVVTTVTTDDAIATISTVGWTKGDYTVQSIDDNSDYQEHTITVD